MDHINALWKDFSKCVKFGTKLTQFQKKISKCVMKIHQHFLVSKRLTNFEKIYKNHNFWNWIPNLLIVWWFVKTNASNLPSETRKEVGCVLTKDTGKSPVHHLIEYRKKVLYPSFSFQNIYDIQKLGVNVF